MNKTNALNSFAKYFDAIETLLIIALVVSLIFTCLAFTKALYGVYAALGLLALLYFVMAMRPFEGKVAGIRIVIRRVVFISYLLSTITIFSALTFDDSFETGSLIVPCLVFLLISAGLMCLKRFKMNEPEKFWAHISRCAVFAIILGWLSFMF